MRRTGQPELLPLSWCSNGAEKMIRVSDIIPRAMPGIASAPATAVACGPSSQAWFDGAATLAHVRISADPGTRSRGLSAAQHAAQVLSHLCEPDDARP
jgi:hypothetical protein